MNMTFPEMKNISSTREVYLQSCIVNCSWQCQYACSGSLNCRFVYVRNRSIREEGGVRWILLQGKAWCRSEFFRPELLA